MNHESLRALCLAATPKTGMRDRAYADSTPKLHVGILPLKTGSSASR